jgi:ATP-dependent DNA helicase RecG
MIRRGGVRDDMNLSELLRQGESETLEFKASFNEDVLESIGALANARGGIVLIGVEDAGSVCGVQIGKKTVEDWAHRIQEATDPRLQPSIRRVEREGKTVVAIVVEPPLVCQSAYGGGTSDG